MANDGLKNEKLVQRILEMGSTALKGKNPFGVNVFSGSIDDDGIISGQLTKTKYNNEELVKSIDTNIFELLPPVIPPTPDVVPRPIYNEATQSILDLQVEVENLNLQVSDLQSLVNDLRIVSQSLRIELDSKDLIVAAVENQNQQTTLQTQATIIDLQNAIQKATSEVIQRTSLSARNQTLEQEIDRLIERLEGKEAKVQEGYEVGETFAWKVENKTDEAIADIAFNSRPRDDGSGRWINGPGILINNFTENAITLTFRIEGSVKEAFRTPTPITLAAKTEKRITIETIPNNIDSSKFRPFRRINDGSDNLYVGSLFAVSSDGGEATFSIELQKQGGDTFNRANATKK
jgi:hypothetical protein